jgi:membrane fusion protein, multidrug efflux system
MIEIYKSILAIILISCASSILAITSCKGEKEVESTPVTRPVKTFIAGGNEGFSRSFPGTVQATQRVNLSFRVSGPLIELPVDEGEEVTKGQLLARIDPRDYKIAVDEARAKYIEAEADYKRYKELYEREAVPLAELDVRRAKHDTAKARLEEAQANLSDTSLKAPFPGFVGAKFAQNYEYIRAQQEILSLQDVSKIEIVVDVPENIIATAREDQERGELFATFQTAPGQKFPLEIKEISAQADPRTLTYRVTLIMPQPEGINVFAGMTAQVHATGSADADEEYPKFIIPAYAVFAADDGTQRVWIIDQKDNTVHQREVKVGSVTGKEGIEILEGIKLGEMIALTGVTALREGMKVRPMKPSRN